MQVERRSLYNSLRLSWKNDPQMNVEPWQVEDYRLSTLEALFDRLAELEVVLDRASYLAYAENFESPEELANCLAGEDKSLEDSDKVYLLTFEIWRRLLPQKQSFSVFCDELDHQIEAYDTRDFNPEALQDILSYLEEILQENADEGEEPYEVFAWVTQCCAHDVESFLYDYIANHIDDEAVAYAADLLEGFYDFVEEPIWFDFLRARILAFTDEEEANDLVSEILEDFQDESSLELALEVLNFLAYHGSWENFVKVVRISLGLLVTEEDLRDLIDICREFYRLRDREEEDEPLTVIYQSRSQIDPDSLLNVNDPDIQCILKIFTTAV